MKFKAIEGMHGCSHLQTQLLYKLVEKTPKSKSHENHWKTNKKDFLYVQLVVFQVEIAYISIMPPTTLVTKTTKNNAPTDRSCQCASGAQSSMADSLQFFCFFFVSVVFTLDKLLKCH